MQFIPTKIKKQENNYKVFVQLRAKQSQTKGREYSCRENTFIHTSSLSHLLDFSDVVRKL
jgi:hypothetical protein